MKKEIINVSLLTQMRAVVTVCWHFRGTWANSAIGSTLNTVAWNAVWDYLLCFLADWVPVPCLWFCCTFGISQTSPFFTAAVTEHKQNSFVTSFYCYENFPLKKKKGKWDRNYKQQTLKYLFLTFWSVQLLTIIPLSMRPQLGKVLISV